MIRVAVISDIHGNYMALEAFLEYLGKHPVDGILCLGDYVTDSPYPERTMELIGRMREGYPCVMVRGNREEYLLENQKKSQGWKPSSANGALYYTALHLPKEAMAFLKGLPREVVFSKDGCPETYLCHGTPGQIRGNVTFGQGSRERALGEIEQKYLFGGHSHHQEIFTQGEKTYLNPGSLRDFRISGLEEDGKILCRAIKKTLVTGINYFYQSILEVQKESALPLAQIPESAWETVAVRLEL